MGTDKRLFEEELDQAKRAMKPYKGLWGQTRLSSVHWTTPGGRITSVRVHTSVNAGTDPGLAEQLCSGTLNWVRLPESDELHPVAVPVVYHDEPLRLFVLMLPPDFRTRELEERAALLSKIASDSGHPVPDYVLLFRVVFGHEELRLLVDAARVPHVETTPVRPPPDSYLSREETRPRTLGYASDEEAEEQDARKAKPRKKKKGKRGGKKAAAAREDKPREVSQAQAMLQAEAEAALEGMESMGPWPGEDAEASPEEVEAESQTRDDARQSTVPEETETIDRPDFAVEGGPAEATEAEAGPDAAGETAAESAEAEREEEEEEEPVVEELPEELQHWHESDETQALYLKDELIYLAARLDQAQIDTFIGVDPKVMVQLHRAPTYPLAVLTLKPPEDPSRSLFWLLDVLNESHLTILEALGKDFRLQIDLYDEDLARVVSRLIHTPLEENARMLRQKATEHLSHLGSADPDYDQAVALWQTEDYDRLGAKEHAFTQKSFEDLQTPSATGTSLKIVSWWADPERQDYLLHIASFPNVWWRKIRTRVVLKAMEFGLWLPEVLLEWTLSEGHATSRKDLLRHCLANFTQVVQDPRQNDLDLAEEQDNWQQLIDEAEKLGVPVEPQAEELASAARDRTEIVQKELDQEEWKESTTEGGDPNETSSRAAAPESVPTDLDPSDERFAEPFDPEFSAIQEEFNSLSTDSLFERLQDKDTRVHAAIALCRRKETSSLGEIFDAIRMMTRQEVVQVLPLVASMGEPAEGHFISELASNKSFLRQGAALALGVIRSGDAIEPLTECLLTEPTGIWREVARVLGDIGQGSIMTLATRLRDANPEDRERIAWALAHVAASAAPKDPLEDLAASRDPVAASVAQRAQELMDEATSAADQVLEGTGEDSVINSFTRQFFNVLEKIDQHLDEPDIIEEAEIVEQEDIIEENPSPAEDRD
jgi:hypothetical protein